MVDVQTLAKLLEHESASGWTRPFIATTITRLTSLRNKYLSQTHTAPSNNNEAFLYELIEVLEDFCTFGAFPEPSGQRFDYIISPLLTLVNQVTGDSHPQLMHFTLYNRVVRKKLTEQNTLYYYKDSYLIPLSTLLDPKHPEFVPALQELNHDDLSALLDFPQFSSYKQTVINFCSYHQIEQTNIQVLRFLLTHPNLVIHESSYQPRTHMPGELEPLYKELLSGDRRSMEGYTLATIKAINTKNITNASSANALHHFTREGYLVVIDTTTMLLDLKTPMITINEHMFSGEDLLLLLQYSCLQTIIAEKAASFHRAPDTLSIHESMLLLNYPAEELLTAQGTIAHFSELENAYPATQRLVVAQPSGMKQIDIAYHDAALTQLGLLPMHVFITNTATVIHIVTVAEHIYFDDLNGAEWLDELTEEDIASMKTDIRTQTTISSVLEDFELLCGSRPLHLTPALFYDLAALDEPEDTYLSSELQLVNLPAQKAQAEALHRIGMPWDDTWHPFLLEDTLAICDQLNINLKTQYFLCNDGYLISFDDLFDNFIKYGKYINPYHYSIELTEMDITRLHEHPEHDRHFAELLSKIEALQLDASTLNEADRLTLLNTTTEQCLATANGHVLTRSNVEAQLLAKNLPYQSTPGDCLFTDEQLADFSERAEVPFKQRICLETIGTEDLSTLIQPEHALPVVNHPITDEPLSAKAIETMMHYFELTHLASALHFTRGLEALNLTDKKADPSFLLLMVYAPNELTYDNQINRLNPRSTTAPYFIQKTQETTNPTDDNEPSSNITPEQMLANLQDHHAFLTTDQTDIDPDTLLQDAFVLALLHFELRTHHPNYHGLVANFNMNTPIYFDSFLHVAREQRLVLASGVFYANGPEPDNNEFDVLCNNISDHFRLEDLTHAKLSHEDILAMQQHPYWYRILTDFLINPATCKLHAPHTLSANRRHFLARHPLNRANCFEFNNTLYHLNELGQLVVNNDHRTREKLAERPELFHQLLTQPQLPEAASHLRNLIRQRSPELPENLIPEDIFVTEDFDIYSISRLCEAIKTTGYLFNLKLKKGENITGFSEGDQARLLALECIASLNPIVVSAQQTIFFFSKRETSIPLKNAFITHQWTVFDISTIRLLFLTKHGVLCDPNTQQLLSSDDVDKLMVRMPMLDEIMPNIKDFMLKRQLAHLPPVNRTLFLSREPTLKFMQVTDHFAPYFICTSDRYIIDLRELIELWELNKCVTFVNPHTQQAFDHVTQGYLAYHPDVQRLKRKYNETYQLRLQISAETIEQLVLLALQFMHKEHIGILEEGPHDFEEEKRVLGEFYQYLHEHTTEETILYNLTFPDWDRPFQSFSLKKIMGDPENSCIHSTGLMFFRFAFNTNEEETMSAYNHHYQKYIDDHMAHQIKADISAHVRFM